MGSCVSESRTSPKGEPDTLTQSLKARKEDVKEPTRVVFPGDQTLMEVMRELNFASWR